MTRMAGTPEDSRGRAVVGTEWWSPSKADAKAKSGLNEERNRFSIIQKMGAKKLRERLDGDIVHGRKGKLNGVEGREGE